MRPTADAIASHEVSIEIAAAPEAIYEMVSDVARMGDWSPEATGARWIDGATGKVGDWFVGTNETPDRTWDRECEVAAAEPGRDFTWVVDGVEKNCTWWSYEMEPAGEGTRLTERWWVVNKTPALAAAPEDAVAQRFAYTEEMMQATVAAIKATAEQ